MWQLAIKVRVLPSLLAFANLLSVAIGLKCGSAPLLRSDHYTNCLDTTGTPV